jgi:TPP-dependent pyruvate/acetoin dehydrogenase alpha subunit
LSESSDVGNDQHATAVASHGPHADQSGATKSLISDEKFRTLYASMLKCRMLWDAVHRTSGKALPRNREASKVACAMDLANSDVVSCASEDYAALFLAGAPPREVLDRTKRNSRSSALSWVPQPWLERVIPPARTTESQIAIATGVAVDFGLRNKGGIVLVFCARPKQSLDIAKDSLEFADDHKLPIIFVVQDQAARKHSSARPSRNSVDPYGFPSIPVDGTDCIAVYRVAFEAMYKARIGAGPTLIECKYEPKPPDPLLHMERQLRRRNLWSDDYARRVTADFSHYLKLASSPRG